MAKAFLLKANESQLRPIEINSAEDIIPYFKDTIPEVFYPNVNFAISIEDVQAFENTQIWIDGMGALREDAIPNLELITTILYGDILLLKIIEGEDEDEFVDFPQEQAEVFLQKMVRGRRNPYRNI